MMFPSYIQDDFFLPIPEITFDVDKALEWVLRNEDKFTQMGGELVPDSFLGGVLPHSFATEVNSQLTLDLGIYTSLQAVFSYPMCWIMYGTSDGYAKHIDARRPCSMNFWLMGDINKSHTTFQFRDCEIPVHYNPGQATLFNAQIPHQIEMLDEGKRIMLSFQCNLGYQMMVNLYRSGRLFTDENLMRTGSNMRKAR